MLVVSSSLPAEDLLTKEEQRVTETNIGGATGNPEV